MGRDIERECAGNYAVFHGRDTGQSPRAASHKANYPITAHPAHTDRLSNHSTTHPTLKLGGFKSPGIRRHVFFATDNCVLSVVFSSPPPPRPPPCFCLSPCCWCLWLPPRGFMKCICVTLLCCMLLYCVTCCVGVALIHPLLDGRSYTLTSKRQSKCCYIYQ